MERTKRGKLEGGDAAWEEKSGQRYLTSEVRLVEIAEQVCKELSRGQSQCHQNYGEWEDHIEAWWAQDPEERPTLRQWLCVESLQVRQFQHQHDDDDDEDDDDEYVDNDYDDDENDDDDAGVNDDLYDNDDVDDDDNDYDDDDDDDDDDNDHVDDDDVDDDDDNDHDDDDDVDDDGYDDGDYDDAGTDSDTEIFHFRTVTSGGLELPLTAEEPPRTTGCCSRGSAGRCAPPARGRRG